jgi:hypothetical protein
VRLDRRGADGGARWARWRPSRSNTVAKEALEADGTVADGYSVDGSTRTGKPPADVVVTTEHEPGGDEPAAEGTTRVEVEDPQPDLPPPDKPKSKAKG